MRVMRALSTSREAKLRGQRQSKSSLNQCEYRGNIPPVESTYVGQLPSE